MGWLSKILGSRAGKGALDVNELARRLNLPVQILQTIIPQYKEFSIPKRGGGARRILVPERQLKAIQRVMLRRLLARLRCHPAAHGFEAGRSIVTNALPHQGRAMVVRMDLKDFFPSISAARVQAYWQHVGWNAEAAEVLTKLCTFNSTLPQGAPTSPRLSNLVNRRLDARLAAAAAKVKAQYTRYADDLTFSFAAPTPSTGRELIHLVKEIVQAEGYTLHMHKKLRIQRQGDRQLVSGLVVNKTVNLPRQRRRWLRAVEHHLATGKNATLTAAQFAGWKSLRSMVERQSKTTPA